VTRPGVPAGHRGIEDLLDPTRRDWMVLLARLLLALLGFNLLAGAAWAADGPAREPHRIVAIGDLHGDYAGYADIVQAAGLADAKGRWTGGDTVLVQMGDIPDRGPDTLRIIRHLQGLEKGAKAAGGEVIALVGNHEAMNVTGDLRYVVPGEYAAFADRNSAARRDRLFDLNKEKLLAFYRASDPQVGEAQVRAKWDADYPLGKIEHRLAWAPNGEIGRWVGAHPAIVKIGRTLFVHGGISVETAVRPIAEVNAAVRAELAKGESQADSILTDQLGPLWYRGNVQRDAPATPGASAEEPGAPAPPASSSVRPSIADELTQVLAAYGAVRLVVAHTPHLKGVVASENGRLIRVDTGISAYYGGARAYLELKDGLALGYSKDAAGNWIREALPPPGGAMP
jgi:hypothetical protein